MLYRVVGRLQAAASLPRGSPDDERDERAVPSTSAGGRVFGDGLGDPVKLRRVSCAGCMGGVLPEVREVI